MGTLILGVQQATEVKAMQWVERRRPSAMFVSLLSHYWRLAPDMGVRPEVAYVQAALETGFGRFGGQVKPEQYNWCGLKTTDGSGFMSFPTPEVGIIAHLHHLALYAAAPGFPAASTPDPRHFPVLKGRSTTVEGLGGKNKWATDEDYGPKLVRLLEEML